MKKEKQSMIFGKNHVSFLNDLEKKKKNLIAGVYMIIGCSLYPLSGAITKMLTNLTGPQILYFRVLVFLLINTVIIKRAGYECFKFQGKKTNLLIIARGIFACSSSLCFFTSLKYISIAETGVIYQTMVLWIALSSIFILKTHTGNLRLGVSIVFCLCGLILMVRPPIIFGNSKEEQIDDSIAQDRFIGMILAFFASIGATGTFIITSYLGNYVNSQVLVQYFAVISALISSLYIITFGASIIPSIVETLQLFAFGIISLLSQSLVSKALTLGNPIRMSILGFSEVIVAYIVDITIFHIELNVLSILGALIIVIGLIFIITDQEKKR